MNYYVFLGPSLPRDEAHTLLDATFLPPAGQGDILTLLQNHPPDAIVLIDCDPERFVPWGAELVQAIEAGVAVYGAGATGAFLAAELHALGMCGVGQVFKSVRAGRLIDEDFVACAFGPEEEGFPRLSEPMVNLRQTLAETTSLSLQERELILSAAEKLNFRARSRKGVISAAVAAGLYNTAATTLDTILRHNYVDILASDTREALTLVNQERPHRTSPTPRSRSQVRLFDADKFAQATRESADVSFTEIAAHAALNDNRCGHLAQSAFNQGVTVMLAEHFGVIATTAEIQLEGQRFWAERGVSQDDYATWLRENNMRQDEFDELIQELAICRKMQAWFTGAKRPFAGVRALINQFRIAGVYPELADSAAREKAAVERLPQNDDEAFLLDSTGIDAALREHFSLRGRPLAVSPATWLNECGVPAASIVVGLWRSWIRKFSVLHRLFNQNKSTDSSDTLDENTYSM
ncbi:TfuA-like protein [Desulfovibrio inopinatus]|uniref:TfuA-like protein n=1 Tax=Desulfovibrio inopinatus TaxID=102109 RepID=UPI0004094E09|nr:TfuA-like protein [Desulfovibrio inopinatus]